MKKSLAFFIGFILLLFVSCDTHVCDFNIHTVVTEPTCERTGVTIHSCECGKTQIETTPALGHDYSEEITENPTCVETGIKVYTCSRCGMTCSEVISKIPHDYKTETVEGITTYTCSACGHIFSEDSQGQHVHTWDDGTVLIHPTFFKAGSIEYQCINCGEKKTEILCEDGCEYDPEGYVTNRTVFSWHPYKMTGETSFWFYDLSEEYSYSADRSSVNIIVCIYGGRPSGVTGTCDLDENGRITRMMYDDLPGVFSEFEYSENGFLKASTYTYAETDVKMLLLFDESPYLKILYAKICSGDLQVQEIEYSYRKAGPQLGYQETEPQVSFLVEATIRNLREDGGKDVYGSYSYSGDSRELLMEENYGERLYWYRYDDLNRLEKSYYEYYDNSEVSSGYVEYNYYDNGLPASSCRYATKIGESAQLTDATEYSQDYPLLVLHESEVHYYLGNPETTDHYYEYENGKTKKETIKNDGILTGYKTYEYSDAGTKTSFSYYDASGKHIYTSYYAANGDIEKTVYATSKPPVENQIGTASPNLISNGDFESGSETDVLPDGSICVITEGTGTNGSKALAVTQNQDYGEVYLDLTEYYGRGKSFYIEASYRNNDSVKNTDLTAKLFYLVVSEAVYNSFDWYPDCEMIYDGELVTPEDAEDVFGLLTNNVSPQLLDDGYVTLSAIIPADEIDMILEETTKQYGSGDPKLKYLQVVLYVGEDLDQDGYSYYLDDVKVIDLNSEIDRASNS